MPWNRVHIAPCPISTIHQLILLSPPGIFSHVGNGESCHLPLGHLPYCATSHHFNTTLPLGLLKSTRVAWVWVIKKGLVCSRSTGWGVQAAFEGNRRPPSCLQKLLDDVTACIGFQMRVKYWAKNVTQNLKNASLSQFIYILITFTRLSLK